VSIGAAVTVEADGDALVSAADAALYRAKSEGRNRVRAAA
jgi:PleD family two-component response regulator